MEGFGTKLSGDLSTYKYGTSTPAFGGWLGGSSGTPASVTTPGYTVQERQMDGGKGMGGAVGGSGVEELAEGSGGSVPSGGGRKKKKKHKSGEDSSASAKPSTVVVDEELADAALPVLSDNQDVEDLLFPSTLPPPGGTLVGGQYLLSNSLLDQILTEKKDANSAVSRSD